MLTVIAADICSFVVLECEIWKIFILCPLWLAVSVSVENFWFCGFGVEFLILSNIQISYVCLIAMMIALDIKSLIFAGILFRVFVILCLCKSKIKFMFMEGLENPLNIFNIRGFDFRDHKNTLAKITFISILFFIFFRPPDHNFLVACPVNQHIINMWP
jgi:hypothetical protein